ncbi:CDP-alcohol phosphatidyltransferase family protein [Parasulfitobacter algicola]|uniref:Phosphatidylcholine synthase n=1 Tax=Parasulfitobacter algicola TaxID=2614809 RepID=A0ABX2IWQ4_9RHOB|nr:CDP-alcohol phosphatidyltransferase family protein [Sulfitobacter algicola]NSX56501.1 CDP-alcohol phosphatidyltransferase family protein [Sulfitobacter algicola]
MANRFKATLVHFLTATGAVFAMLALIAAVEESWSMMFLWLVVALLVDGIDGPLARRYDVKSHAPQFDGAILDLIIDYLTYVFIPAYALFKSGLLGGWLGWYALVVITFASAMYFADTRMKTKDNSFSGFPGCWNMVVLVFFAIEPDKLIITGVVTLLAITMFVPAKFIHPVRTARWRTISLPVVLGWTVFAAWAAWVDFDPDSWAHWGLIVTSIYLMVAGILQQLIPVKAVS